MESVRSHGRRDERATTLRAEGPLSSEIKRTENIERTDNKQNECTQRSSANTALTKVFPLARGKFTLAYERPSLYFSRRGRDQESGFRER